MFLFAGIDIGGSKNSWLCVISYHEGLSHLYTESLTLPEIRDIFQANRVLACAIDAPITYSLSLSSGMRSADKEVKRLLPTACKKWLLSYNALMGIPIRASILCQHISPYCGTILETLPRANLYYMLPDELKEIAFIYKETLSEETIQSLLSLYRENFGLELTTKDLSHEGKIDALNCALVAYLYHREPEKLYFLPQDEKDLIGFGPFVIIKPDSF